MRHLTIYLYVCIYIYTLHTHTYVCMCEGSTLILYHLGHIWSTYPFTHTALIRCQNSKFDTHSTISHKLGIEIKIKLCLLKPLNLRATNLGWSNGVKYWTTLCLLRSSHPFNERHGPVWSSLFDGDNFLMHCWSTLSSSLFWCTFQN